MKYSILYDDGDHSIPYEDYTELGVAQMMFQQCVAEGPYHEDILSVELVEVKDIGDDNDEIVSLIYHEFTKDDD